jgi:2-dehydropantoate 2-reductase
MAASKRTAVKIAIVGAGGLGGYFGARLAASGHEVAFIARGSHLAAIQQDGLRVTSSVGDLHLPTVFATDDMARVGVADIVLVSVKLWDAEAVAAQLTSMVGPDTAVISFQNGVDKDDILAGKLSPRAVMGGVSYIAARIGRPGEIVHTGTMQRLVFGELDGSRSSRAEAFLAACTSAGIAAEISPDIRSLTWQKFVFLVGLSSMTTAARLPIGRVRSCLESRAMLLEVMQEAVAVAEAEGISLPSDFAEDRLKFCDGLPPEMTSSMHEDLKAGRRLELPWLSGKVVRLAAAHGVRTPANSAIVALLGPHAAGA